MFNPLRPMAEDRQGHAQIPISEHTTATRRRSFIGRKSLGLLISNRTLGMVPPI